MWTEFLTWWQTLWTDATIIGGAIAGFFAALIMFLLSDVIWKSHIERVKQKHTLREKQLTDLYAPLYSFYKQAYIRFDVWKRENPDTTLNRQPFFEEGLNESEVHELMTEHAGLASPSLLNAWLNYSETNDKSTQGHLREIMIREIIVDYHKLRKQLKIEFDKDEMKQGMFSEV